MSKNIVSGDKELIAKFRAMSDAAKGAALVPVAEAGGDVVLNAANENIKDQHLYVTRELNRSIKKKVTEKSATQASVEVGTNLEYAAIHEFGGVITPKKGKYLAIPVGTYKGSPLDHGDLRTIQTHSGELVMVDGEKRVQYVLKSSVEIPARPYLRPALDENSEEAVNEMGKAFRDVIEKASGG